MREPAGRPHGARLFDLLMLGLGLFLLTQAYGIAGFEALSSPGALPLAAAGVLVVAALIGALRPEASVSAPTILPFRLLLLAAAIGAFAWTLQGLGFLIAGTLFLAFSFLLLAPRKPGRALLLAPVATLTLWALFRLVFEVLLPEGVVPERAILAWIGDGFAALRGAK